MEEDEKIEVSKKLLKTLTVDTRTDILKSLQNRPMTASELSRKLNKHVTTVSEHLDVLKESNLVEKIERPGRKWIYYRLTKPGESIVHPQSYKWVFVLATTFLTCVGGLYLITANTYPGHWLYPIERIRENIQLLLATNSLQKAQLHTQYAEERLEETKKVVERGQTNMVGGIMRDYENEVNQAKKEIEIAKQTNQNIVPALETLSESTSKQKTILQNLATKNPEVKEEIQPALNVSEESHATAVAELVSITGKEYGKESPEYNASVTNYSVPVSCNIP
jgi:DNA-binding transcriptional ArsR family regulator